MFSFTFYKSWEAAEDICSTNMMLITYTFAIIITKYGIRHVKLEKEKYKDIVLQNRKSYFFLQNMIAQEGSTWCQIKKIEENVENYDGDMICLLCLDDDC